MRFFAALMVLLHHISADYLTVLFPSFSQYTQLLFFTGGMGVDLFFILSGFVLAYNYSDYFQHFNLKRYGLFLYKRLARIYPLYLSFLIALIALALFQFYFYGNLSIRFDGTDLLPTFAMIQAWKVPPSFTWNTVAWSVSAEWLAYLLLPFFLVVLTNIKSRRAILLTIAALYLGLILTASHFITQYGNGTVYLPGLRDIGLLRILAEFPIGILLFFFTAACKHPHKLQTS